MRPEKLFIIGSRGYIGSHLLRYYRASGIPSFGSHEFMMRTENPVHVRKVLNLMKPTLLIHSVNYPVHVNAVQAGEWIYSLGEICRDSEIPWIFLSSDLVFGGEKGGYGEEEDPYDEHGGQKALRRMENAVLDEFSETGSVVRIPRVWSENVHTGTLEKNPLAEVYRALDGIPVTFSMSEERGLLHWRTLADSLVRIRSCGIYHISEGSLGSNLQTAVEFARALGADHWLMQQHITGNSAEAAEKRNVTLNTAFTEKRLGMKFSGSREKIREILRKNLR